MDGAKKTLLATVFTAAITASAAAYAGVISVPEFNLSIPTPDQSAPSQPGQSMAIPTIPSGTQIPTTTQLPPSVAALPSIATSGQSGVPIYGNPVPSTDSTGASGVPQNLASSCYASGGSWNPSTSTCSTNSTSSISSQCAQMGGQYDWTKNQCQMASLPGSNGGGSPWLIGAHLANGGISIYDYWYPQINIVKQGDKTMIYVPRHTRQGKLTGGGDYIDVTNQTTLDIGLQADVRGASPPTLTLTGMLAYRCTTYSEGSPIPDGGCGSYIIPWVR